MIDKYSDTWKEIAKWARTRRAAAWADIAIPNLDPIKTEFLRGRIAELDALLGLGEEPEAKPVILGADYGFQEPGEV